MIKNPDYILATIGDQEYILPIAQNIADQKNSIQVNKTGSFLWNALDNYYTIDELANALIEHFNLDNDMLPTVYEDIISFISKLEEADILCYLPECDRYDYNLPSTSDGCTYTIGSIPIRLIGFDDDYLSPFSDFASDDINNNQACDIILSLHEDVKKTSNKLIFKTQELAVYQGYDFFKIKFLDNELLEAAYIKANGKSSIIYAQSKVKPEDIFNAIRFIYSYIAIKNNLLFIHSASILYEGRAYLFSAPSGMGKSTHARIWQEVYDITQLNGDLNLIGLIDNQAYVLATPWCGTSNIYTKDNHPLGGIIFLEQANSNKIEELDYTQAIFKTLQRAITPKWDKAMVEKHISVIQKIVPDINVAKLSCKPDKEAAITAHDYIKDKLCHI